MCSQPGYLECGVMLFSRNKVKELPNVGERTQVGSAVKRPAGFQAGNKPTVERTRWLTLLAVPVAVAIALALHWFAAKKEPPGETLLYTCFLSGLLFAAVLAAALYPLWSGLRNWIRTSGPLIAVAVLFLTGWELTTAGFRLVPLPYFPSPASVLQSLVNDRSILFDSTWHSLILLLSGYALGVLTGLFSGICIGGFPHACYWGM